MKTKTDRLDQFINSLGELELDGLARRYKISFGLGQVEKVRAKLIKKLYNYKTDKCIAKYQQEILEVLKNLHSELESPQKLTLRSRKLAIKQTIQELGLDSIQRLAKVAGKDNQLGKSLEAMQSDLYRFTDSYKSSKKFDVWEKLVRKVKELEVVKNTH